MMETTMEAVEAADTLREETWGETIPVDPAQIAERLGIQVLAAQFSEELAGAIIKKEGQDPRIFLNANDSPMRKRFTCAHEIGHYMQAADAPDMLEFFDYRSSFSSENMPSGERYANTFAALLLMPRDAVEDLEKEKLDRVEMALRFGVTREALQFRLNLDLS